MSDQASRFLCELYDGIHQGYLNVWSKRGRESASSWHLLEEACAIKGAEAKAAELDRQGWDVYFGVCPASSAKTGSARIKQTEVASIPAYFMDVDTMEDESKAEKRVPESVEDAVERLKTLPLPPSACIRSGHGLHAYWFLSEPIAVNGKSEEAKARLRAFADAVAGEIGCPDLDAHASEPARVLRMPGTHNHKGGGALPVMVEYVTEVRYAAEELDAFAQTVGPEVEEQAVIQLSPAVDAVPPVAPNSSCSADYQPGGKYYLTDDALWQMLSRKNDRILRLKNGDLTDYSGDHSAADQAMCNALAFATGCNAARMDELFRSTMLYRAKWDEKHGSGTYGEMTIRKACEDTGSVYRGRDWKLDRMEEETKQDFEAVRAAYERSSGGAYAVEPFRTVAERVDRNGNVSVEPLADFVAVPVETVLRDDGAEQTREYIMEGYDYRGRILPRVSVPAAKLDSFRWVMESWPGAVIEPGQNKKDKLRAAIQKVERETARRREVYIHTGWRKLNGKWKYLYHGGAVGAEGISVEMSGKLIRYALPDGAADLKNSVLESVGLLELAPYRATAPLLASMYLAPLMEFFAGAGERVSHMLTVRGKTQSKKSVLTALFLTHFGLGFTYNTLPLNFQSTANAICGQLFQLKDVPAVVDDFHPTAAEKRGSGVDEMTRTARRINRAVGDDAGRARLNSDGKTLQEDRPSRGLVIITAEFEPDLGESGDSRCFVCPLNPGDVKSGDRLDAAQETGRRGVYASAMRGYIEFIAEKVNADQQSFEEWLRASFREKRHRLNEQGEGYGGHGRLATAGAHLLTAVDLMLIYAQKVGAVRAEEAEELRGKCERAILSDLAAHAESVKDTDPMIVFARALSEIALQDGALLTPEEAAFGVSDSFIGYRTPDALYLSPGKALAAVSDLLRRNGSPFPISSRELWRRLHEAGVASTAGGTTQHIPNMAKSKYVVRLDDRRMAALRDSEEVRSITTGVQIGPVA